MAWRRLHAPADDDAVGLRGESLGAALAAGRVTPNEKVQPVGKALQLSVLKYGSERLLPIVAVNAGAEPGASSASTA